MLSKSEVDSITSFIQNEITNLERVIFETMWSEHCSYKSTKQYFHHFNTSSPNLVLGIGEGAGLIDVGDGYVIGLAMESHNHPSAIDPFNGASTGVGGIIRDILSQGCKPIAILDCLRFGFPEINRQKLLLDQVVLGISSYGNCVGIPNLGGDIEFADEFSNNPLVNVMCIGIAKKENICRSVANTLGDKFLLYGSKTGKDGIGGVTFASEDLISEDDTRSSIQIGNPLKEKILIDVTLELVDRNLLNGLQDLGGGGLICASTEMCEKGKTGANIYIEKVPTSENLKNWEILVSESQERMLAIVHPNNISKVVGILKKHELDYAIIGDITDSMKYNIFHNKIELTSLQIDFLINGCPNLKHDINQIESVSGIPKSTSNNHPLIQLLSNINIASRESIYRQYDQHVQGNTVLSPGTDAGVLILPNGKYLAISAGTNSFKVSRNYQLGTELATLDIVRAVIVRGARPLGLVDSINAGNPEKKESISEFVALLKGIAKVSHELEIPVVGGNVSLYNESDDGSKILPSPFVGVAGIIDKFPIRDKIEIITSKLIVIGTENMFLEGSEYHRQFGGVSDSMNVCYDLERKCIEFFNTYSQSITSSKVVCRGGLITTLAKWAIQSNVGLNIMDTKKTDAFYWGEAGPQYIIQLTAEQEDYINQALLKLKIPYRQIAEIIDDKIFIFEDNKWGLDYLAKIWQSPIQEALS